MPPLQLLWWHSFEGWFLFTPYLMRLRSTGLSYAVACVSALIAFGLLLNCLAVSGLKSAHCSFGSEARKQTHARAHTQTTNVKRK